MPDYSGRDWEERAFTIGIGGPVGSGKTALLLALCRAMRDEYNIGEFLYAQNAGEAAHTS
jgi:urease accessory protein